MNNRDWEILSTLQKEQSLSRSANKLFISQPALTTRIKKIEKELGVRIGHRTKKRLRLPPQGDYLASEAAGLLKSYEDLKGHLWNMDRELTGTLKIGLSNFMTSFH